MNTFRIVQWFRNHKPIDYKWGIIIILLIQYLQQKGALLFCLFMGIISYPTKIDYIPIFEEGGNKIGEAYTIGMTRLYEAGLNIGESLSPNNIFYGKLIIYSILVVVGVLIGLAIIWVINIIMYKIGKKK